MEMQGRRLFSLPAEQKLKAKRSPQGISGYGLSGTATFFKKKLWCEGFTCIGSAIEHAKKLWPEDHQEFCDTKDEYESEMRRLAIKMMSLVGKTLGVTEWCHELHSHFLTLLYQGDVEGLHYLHNGKWIVAPIVPNAIVVSFGDVFEILSNGRYKSPLHRSVPNNSRSRFSIAYFWGPPYAAVIEPAPQLVDSQHPPLYKSVTRNEFLRAKGVGLGDGLALFRTEQSQLPGERN